MTDLTQGTGQEEGNTELEDSSLDTSANDQTTDESVEDTSTDDSDRPLSLRETITKALEKSEGKTEEQDKASGDKSVAKANLQNAKGPTAKAPAEEVDPITGEKLLPINAPAGLTPLLKEKWNSVPREFQKFWADRERHMAENFRQNAEYKKQAAQYNELLAPYSEHFKQVGETAQQHLDGLLRLSYTMTHASPQEKAQVFFNLINMFQPDPATMTALFNGQVSNIPVNANLPTPTKTEEQIAQEYLSRQEMAKTESEAESAIQTFRSDPQNEFIDAVAPYMQRIINAGLVPDGDAQTMLKTAYDMACQQHPEVQKVLELRKAAAAPQAQKQVKPVQGVKPPLGSGIRAPQAQKRMTTREAVRAAFEAHSQ